MRAYGHPYPGYDCPCCAQDHKGSRAREREQVKREIRDQQDVPVDG